jgi:hypothetical protein
VGWPPYRAALRLCVIASAHWAEIDAAYASADIIWFPPHRFLNVVYTWTLDRLPPEKREEWVMTLNDPLPGESPSKTLTAAEVEDEGAGFMAAMQQLKGGF